MRVFLLSKSDSWNGVLEQIYVVPAITTITTTTPAAATTTTNHPVQSCTSVN
jgi:hypothetical protein